MPSDATARSEFTRIQLAREKLAEDSPADARLARREAELLRVHREAWQVLDARDVFRHGQVVEITLDAHLTKPSLKSLMARAPLEKISLSGWAKRSGKQWAELFAEPSLTRLKELWVQDDAGHATFIESPAARAVRRLELTAAQAKRVAKGGYAVKEAEGRDVDDAQWVNNLGPVLGSIEALTLEKPTDATLSLLLRKATSLRRLVITEPMGSLKALPALSARLESLDVRASFTPRLASALTRCRNVTALSCYQGTAPLLPMLRSAAKSLRFLRSVAMDARVLEQVRFERLRELQLYRPTALPDRFPPTLTRLEVEHCTMNDAHVAALRTSKILRSLRLDFCALGNAAGQLFATWPAAAGLHTLSLNGNHILDKEVCERIEKRLGHARMGSAGWMLGYQHPLEQKEQTEEPPPPKQRPAPKLPPHRKDRVRGLQELIGRAHFASWDGYVAKELIARSERLIDTCARALVTAPEAKQLDVLRRCIAGFNRFSASIFTIEAEDIITTFELLASYTKYAEEEDLADRWRDF